MEKSPSGNAYRCFYHDQHVVRKSSTNFQFKEGKLKGLLFADCSRYETPSQ